MTDMLWLNVEDSTVTAIIQTHQHLGEIKEKAQALSLHLSKDEFTPSLHHSHMCMIDGSGFFFPL